MPCGSHCCYIIQHMTLWLFYSSKVWNNLFRLHYYLTQKQNARADKFSDQSHHTHNCMYLRQISACRMEFLPYIWHCINSNDINSLVCQIEEIIHHFIEYSWIFVIEIPLIRIKCRHYIVTNFWKPCKVARCSRREYLRNCLFIFRWNNRIIKKEIAAHIFSISLTCLLCPFMIL